MDDGRRIVDSSISAKETGLHSELALRACFDFAPKQLLEQLDRKMAVGSLLRSSGKSFDRVAISGFWAQLKKGGKTIH
jgi:hypothetical protein